ncbi:hypothetical protein DKX38_028026 [Salix brachista]|uniref:Uncharacterized protein n=1 Tax=Salix brachista TaxID=2182728 RepID=A0A5N5J868_9ROSI|nr:hypothetical protein DKX38_028026 [Salix brachista]
MGMRSQGDFKRLWEISSINWGYSWAVPFLGWLNGTVGEEDKDFIHVLLSNLDGGKVSADDTEETAIKGTYLYPTLHKFSRNPYMTLVTLTWALSLILNSREVLGMAQDELDTQVGKHWQVDEIDIKNLVYFPAAPLSAPRQAMEDCTVAGLQSPAGTFCTLTLVRLLHGFEMGTVSDTLFDMSEGPGMTLPKETPLEAKKLSLRASSCTHSIHRID